MSSFWIEIHSPCFWGLIPLNHRIVFFFKMAALFFFTLYTQKFMEKTNVLSLRYWKRDQRQKTERGKGRLSRNDWVKSGSKVCEKYKTFYNYARSIRKFQYRKQRILLLSLNNQGLVALQKSASAIKNTKYYPTEKY